MSGYIVTFKESATKEQIEKLAQEVQNDGGEVTKKFTLISGFAAKIQPQTLQSFKSLQGDVIDTIEPDSIVTIQ